jgi:outer membrane receptor for ferrienterochelin and colicins
MRRFWIFGAAALALAPTAGWAQEGGEEEIIVTARQRALAAGTLADVTQQTEIIDQGDLQATQSSVLSEALLRTPGARVTNECSMCGYKRVTLNGLAGQHTTFLIDGLPAHTLVSGFYGPDALSIAGVERIEVARGAGASLTAPEAIGGTVNIITQTPTDTGFSFNGAAGDVGYRQGDLIGTYASGDGRLTGIFALQFDTREQTDEDDNGVSENPFLENTNVSARVSFDPTSRSTVSVRAGYTESVIFGGPVIGDTTSSIGSALASFDGTPSASLFVDDDVRNRYIGEAWETAEWIDTTRGELSARYFQEFSPSLNLDAGISYASHEQDSFYEGFDCRADNEMLYWTARVNWALSDDHLITIGVDRRDETLRSESDVAIGNPDFISDSFDYLTQGFFIQDTWTPSDRLEAALAVRVDQIEADFIDPQRPGVEIDETLVSPRLDVRYAHNDALTSRFSVGQGYRAPLSFFETDHGILDAGLGFQVDVDELERSLSATYALSYARDRLTWTAAFAWTAVDNLAVLDEIDIGGGNFVPLLTQQDETGEVYGVTFDLGYALTDDLNLSLTAEAFAPDAVMRSVFAVATIEERIIAGVEWHPGAWDIHFDATWVGPRDLADYGYEGFNDAGATLQKTLEADSYVTVDARAEFAFNERFAIYAGGRNLFDYTQAGDEDSPLFFDASGGYDVAYIYGPLRGRELYAGLRVRF